MCLLLPLSHLRWWFKQSDWTSNLALYNLLSLEAVGSDLPEVQSQRLGHQIWKLNQNIWTTLQHLHLSPLFCKFSLILGNSHVPFCQNVPRTQLDRFDEDEQHSPLHSIRLLLLLRMHHNPHNRLWRHHSSRWGRGTCGHSHRDNRYFLYLSQVSSVLVIFSTKWATLYPKCETNKRNWRKIFRQWVKWPNITTFKRNSKTRQNISSWITKSKQIPLSPVMKTDCYWNSMTIFALKSTTKIHCPSSNHVFSFFAIGPRDFRQKSQRGWKKDWCPPLSPSENVENLTEFSLLSKELWRSTLIGSGQIKIKRNYWRLSR